MPRKKPDPQPRAKRPAVTVTVDVERDPNTEHYRGVVFHPNPGGGDPVYDYRGTSWYTDDQLALEDAIAWCRDRGITCQEK